MLVFVFSQEATVRKNSGTFWSMVMLVVGLVLTLGLVHSIFRSFMQEIVEAPVVTAGISKVGQPTVAPVTPVTPVKREAKSLVGDLAQFVPQPIPISFDFEGGDILPMVTPDQIMQAGRFLLTMEGNPRLNTKDDAEAFEILRGYMNGTRVIHWDLMEIQIPGAANTNGQPIVARMAYSCAKDAYAIAPVRATTELLALSFYHEIGHAVQCERKLRELGVTNHAALEGRIEVDPCAVEPRPYAAQVRMFLAMYETGRLPKVLGEDPSSSDAGLLSQTKEVWQMLLDGQEVFCTWYKAMVAGGANTDHGHIREMSVPGQ